MRGFPLATRKIADGVYAALAVMNNFYILDANGAWMVFDTGMNPLLSAYAFKKLGLDTDKVRHVFLTHSDYDHMGGVKAFSHATVYLSEKEEPMVTGYTPRMLFKYNKRLAAYQTLADRQTVEIGNRRVQIISTPGHTPGSACFWVDDSILIAGDTLRVKPDGRITPFMRMMNMNHAENTRAVEKLRTEGLLTRAKMILTGHTGAVIMPLP